jgi:hypothetical protein
MTKSVGLGMFRSPAQGEHELKCNPKPWAGQATKFCWRPLLGKNLVARMSQLRASDPRAHSTLILLLLPLSVDFCYF